MKCAIFALVKGYEDVEGYDLLRRRNILLHENFNKHCGYDVILFHEGNITPAHQGIISSDVPGISFVDVGDRCFVDTPEILRHHREGGVHDRDLGFKHMCRFNGIQLYEYLAEYDYIMRVDDDVFIESPLDPGIVEHMRNDGLRLAYGRRKIDLHGPTKRTFYPWLRRWIAQNDIKINCSPAMVTNYNFYNNFYIAEMAFWRRPDVQSYLNAVDRSGGIYRFRWGDSPIQAMAYMMFSHPREWLYLDGFRYAHGSHRWSNVRPSNEWEIDGSLWVS